MNSTRKTKTKLSQEPVPPKNSIEACFARQRAEKQCQVCYQTFPNGIYRRHINNCSAKIDDNECMITQIKTAEEKIGPPIYLDSTFKEEEPSCSTDNPSSSIYSDEWSNNGTISSSIRRRSSTESLLEEKPVVPKKRRISMSIKSEPSANSNDGFQGSGIYKRNVLVKSENPETYLNAGSEGQNSSQTVPESDHDLITSEGLAVRGEQDNQNKTLRDVLMNMEENSSTAISGNEPSRPLSAPIDSENHDPEENVLDEEEQDEEQGNEKYFVKMVNKILERVVHSQGRYGPDFWRGNNLQLVRYEDLKMKEKELFMRLFLRKRQWFCESELKTRYKEYKNVEIMLKNLTENGFLEKAKSLSIDEVCQIADLPKLQQVCKIFKLDSGKPRNQLIDALKKFATSQQDFFGRAKGMTVRIVETFMKELGKCYRIVPGADIPFKALLTLYSPTETNSVLIIDDPRKNIESEFFFSLLQHQNKAWKFPAPSHCISVISIYREYGELKEYVMAKELEITVAKAIHYRDHDKAVELGKAAKEHLLLCDLEYTRSLQPSLRRFTAPYVLTRIIAHVASAYEKRKQYGDAVVLQRFLLKDKNAHGFCCDRRGALWERLALNLEAHLKEPEEALEELELALNDPFVKEKDLVTLQDRILKLTRNRFEKVIDVALPKEVRIKGNVLRKNLGDARQNRFVRRSGDDLIECSVEEIARQYYLENEDMTYGVHREGTIWHTVFGLLFYDIIFSHEYDDIWLSEIQTHPVDLNYPEFYEKRKTEFEDRLNWFENTSAENILTEVSQRWELNFGVSTTEIDWTLFSSPEECALFINTCPRKGLTGIIRRLIMDYRNTRSGFPDLTMWNTDTKTVVVAEVKGPGDRLSSKQRLWLQHFSTLGFRAEVCYVEADRITRI